MPPCIIMNDEYLNVYDSSYRQKMRGGGGRGGGGGEGEADEEGRGRRGEAGMRGGEAGER